jgi:hypothetical protein
MNSEQIEKILASAKVSMEMEGFDINEELQDNTRKMLRGEKSREECIDEYKQMAVRFACEV